MSLYKPGRPEEYDPYGEDCSGKPPSAKGEYRIESKLEGGKRDVKYVGVTNNLNRRCGEHQRTGKLSEGDIFAYKVADGRASQSRLNDHERQKIEQHDPPLNQRAGGAGRPYKKIK